MYCQEERELSCDSCYEISIEYCADINIDPDLVPGGYENFYLQIIDKFTTRRTQEVELNMDGSFDVDTSVLPDDFFNPYAGKFELYLSYDEDGLNRVDMTFDDVVYDCIILTITKTIDNECC
jgi:hypothetical protein